MPTYTAAWTTAQVLHTSSSVANAGTATDNVDLASLGFYGISAQIDVTSTGSPNGDVTVEVFGSVDGGSNKDTIAKKTIKIPFTSVTQKLETIEVFAIPYASIKLTNNTGASVTYVGRYGGLKQAS